MWGSGYDPQNSRALLEGDDINEHDHDHDHDHINNKIVDQSDNGTSNLIGKNAAPASTFDLDLGFLESALLSDVVCHDLDSMEYDLSWDY